METIFQDLRYGWRMLRKSPGFVLVIVLMLALGIGANTAVFTVLRAALLRPLPFEKPEELAQVWETRTSGAFQQMESSDPDFVDMRNSQVFAQLGGYSRTTMTLSQPSGAVQVTVAMASTGFFETLGVRPVLGRTSRSADPPRWSRIFTDVEASLPDVARTTILAPRRSSGASISSSGCAGIPRTSAR